MARQEQKNKTKAEFGDFQTPENLAVQATRLLLRRGIQAKTIIEPTCGKGAFVFAASSLYPEADKIIGVDINASYLGIAENRTDNKDTRINFLQGDFFSFNWNNLVAENQKPLMILGNPPWVTSSILGSLESSNLPEKSNFHGRQGIEAITGKSNFDISEWMLLRYLDWLKDDCGTIAVLCKNSVARKILLHIWKKKMPLYKASIYKIDAFSHFGAAVDACFFLLEMRPREHNASCDIFDSFDSITPSQKIGFIDGHIISDISSFNEYRELLGTDANYTWRSGIKHDCSKIMELIINQDGYVNGFDNIVDIEENLLFPLLKSSDIGNGRIE